MRERSLSPCSGLATTTVPARGARRDQIVQVRKVTSITTYEVSEEARTTAGSWVVAPSGPDLPDPPPRPCPSASLSSRNYRGQAPSSRATLSDGIPPRRPRFAALWRPRSLPDFVPHHPHRNRNPRGAPSAFLADAHPGA